MEEKDLDRNDLPIIRELMKLLGILEQYTDIEDEETKYKRLEKRISH